MILEEEGKKKKRAPHRIGFTQPVDEDFDCDYSPISSLFDGAGVYHEEPFTEYKCEYRVEGLSMVHRRWLRERYLRQSKIYRYEGWYEG